MYLKINNKKLEVKELTSFKERFKSLKFVFEPLTYGIKMPNKKIANTYFFVQKVDICFTDSDNRIIKLKDDVRTEKIIINFKATNIFYFPLGTNKELKINEVLKEKN